MATLAWQQTEVNSCSPKVQGQESRRPRRRQTQDQLLAHWLTVIFWFKKKQLFVAMSKVHIGCESIRFLGFCTGYNLQFADVERCRAIALIPEPKTQKENKRFIGGAGFYVGTVPRSR